MFVIVSGEHNRNIGKLCRRPQMFYDMPCTMVKAQLSREIDRLEMLLAQIKTVEAERNALLAAESNSGPGPAAMLLGIKGIGPEFASVLCSEGLFRNFNNRRQLAAYAGLAPIASKVYRKPATSDCGQHPSNWPGTGCAISRTLR